MLPVISTSKTFSEMVDVCVSEETDGEGTPGSRDITPRDRSSTTLESADIESDWVDTEVSGRFVNNLMPGEKVVYSSECSMITSLSKKKGSFVLTQSRILFVSIGGGREENWKLSNLTEIYGRRYLLRQSALELFFSNGTNVMLNFEGKSRRFVIEEIIKLNPPNLNFKDLSVERMLEENLLTEKWVKYEISNFEYLMRLNTLAGRTYNDLTQYPVFPWILKDYESETLDLTNREIYRDLSLPMGAQQPDRLQQIIERYESFDDPVIKKFHYGSHYSSAGIILFYLIRMEPYTTLNIELQGGRFDCPDRLFHGIPEAWEGALESMSDVKELIPEFFCNPSFLLNQDKFDLGTRQESAGHVNHVKLPKWAKTPEDFIRKHREALESDYVSQHLHNWIDLIFGYKQRGPEAVKATNVFYYLTYENEVDLDKIKDPKERSSTEAQIIYFGQTPSQLFKSKHRKRMPKSQIFPSFFTFPERLKCYDVAIATPRTSCPLVHATLVQDKLITFHSNMQLGVYRFDVDIYSRQPFSLRAEIFRFLSSAEQSVGYSKGLIGHSTMTSRMFGVPCADKKSLGLYTPVYSCFYWDCSIKMNSAENPVQQVSDSSHRDLVTCMSVASDNIHIATGSLDCTCIIWNRDEKKGIIPVYTLCGHTQPITCITGMSERNTTTPQS